mmetsp:Transcript_21196/g.68381  ORF Transcript_21196/g.68381 Transcript_21196/m.68381 type:complete len:90 (-) Transcript_21196:214-483(-)
MYVAEFPAGADPKPFPVAAGRQAYLLCVEGQVDLLDDGIATKTLAQHDAAELQGPLDALAVCPTAGNKGHVLIFEMAQVSGSGRQDAEL